ncbi:MAG: hypothetical protein ABFC62_03260 [Clostridiaceae bacterium]|nr:hypothetical protein [Eubacteriales bacterium]
MWSKTVTAFLLSVKIRGDRAEPGPREDGARMGKRRRGRFGLWFAFPVPLLLMFVDMAEDWAILLTPFVNNKTAGRVAKLAWAGVRASMALALELCFETGPTDFVDIDVRKRDENVRVRILTR